MKIRLQPNKRMALAGIVILLITALGIYALMHRVQRVPMERYAPADSLAILEIDSLTDLTDGLTSTTAWKELAPALGISSQWRQVGSVLELAGVTGIGPNEARLLGRAQWSVVVTDLKVETGNSEEGPFLHIRPRLAVVAETHLTPAEAADIVKRRASIIAARIFGNGVVEDVRTYDGAPTHVFGTPGNDRVLVAASSGTAIVLANGEEPAKRCLDVIAGGAPSLAQDSELRNARAALDSNAELFSFVSRRGLQKLVELAPLAMSNSVSADSVTATVELLQHLSEQASQGMAYSARFVDGGVKEQYLWALRSQVADGLIEAARPSADRSLFALKLVPEDVRSISVLNLDRPGDFPERLLKQLAPRVDVVLAVALREAVISLKRDYGLRPSESLGDAIGSQVELIDFEDGEPRATLIRVTDRMRLEPIVSAYLSRDGSTVQKSQENDAEVLASNGDEHRAAAFIGDLLILGTRDQVRRVIQVSGDQQTLLSDSKASATLGSAPANALLVSYAQRDSGAGELFLGLSRLLRVTDGSREILEQPALRKALAKLPASTSFTELRESGLYTESQSAVGNFRRLAALIGD
jgi:hypothetical protein